MTSVLLLTHQDLATSWLPEAKQSLATLVLGSPQNSPALYLLELLLEPVNSHLKGHSVMEGGVTQRPQSLQSQGRHCPLPTLESRIVVPPGLDSLISGK